MNVSVSSDSLEKINRFTLVGKGPAQCSILFLALASLGFTLWVCAVCVRTTKGMKRWMWVSFILVGVGQLAVNWTTGDISYTLLALQVPCAGVRTTAYGPWMIVVYAPLGALFFLNEQWRKKVVGKSIDDTLPAK